MDGNFSKKIFFSDEAHFTLDVYANKQNCRIFGSVNSQVIEESTFRKSHSLVRSLVHDGTAVPVNSACNGHVTTRLFLPAIEAYDLENMWFKHDGERI